VTRGRRSTAVALSALVLLCLGCSVRIPPSDAPGRSSTPQATDLEPSLQPPPTLVPAPTVAWQMADLGAVGDEIGAFVDVAVARDGLVALGVLKDLPAGRNLRLLSSSDGIAWRLVAWPADSNVRSMAASDGVVWAFGRQPAEALETSVWRTEDGEAWTEMVGMTGHDVGVGRVIDLVGTDGRTLMLVHRAPNPENYSSVVLRTDDGVTWADVPPVRDISWGLHTLTGDERGYLVTYTNGASGPPGIDEAWFSPDGIEWTAHELPGVGSGMFVDSAAAHGRFVVGGGAVRDEGTVPAIWASEDGRRWTRTLLEEEATGSVDVVVPTADGFVGLGWMSEDDLRLTRSWWSPDGASWVASGDLPPLGYAMAAVEWNERLIAVGGLNGEAGSVSPAVWVGDVAR
jgi:hypothetical protein